MMSDKTIPSDVYDALDRYSLLDDAETLWVLLEGCDEIFAGDSPNIEVVLEKMKKAWDSGFENVPGSAVTSDNGVK